jgi:arginine repressor
MKRIVWLIIGLVIGGGGMCAYHTYVREPKLIAETTQSVKEMIEQEKLASQTVISGSLVEIDGTDITVLVGHDIGESSLAVISTDSNTAVYQLKNDETLTKEKISLSAIPFDSFITITLDNATINGNSLYAKEITKI